MAFVLLILAILFGGILLMGMGAVLLFYIKASLVIILGVGLLMTLVSILGFLSLVIATRTMG
jgi:hypothetical protein